MPKGDRKEEIRVRLTEYPARELRWLSEKLGKGRREVIEDALIFYANWLKERIESKS